MNNTPYFTPLLKEDRPVWIMGAHDVLSAKIAEKAGFDGIGVQSLQMSFVNGQPDTGVITATEMLETVRKIRRSPACRSWLISSRDSEIPMQPCIG